MAAASPTNTNMNDPFANMGYSSTTTTASTTGNPFGQPQQQQQQQQQQQPPQQQYGAAAYGTQHQQQGYGQQQAYGQPQQQAQQQQSMVPAMQQTNQWAVHPQQQSQQPQPYANTTMQMAYPQQQQQQYMQQQQQQYMQQQQPGGYGMPSSNQSVASSNYINPATLTPYSATQTNAASTQSVVTSPAGNQQQYQNYMQQPQQTHQQQQQQVPVQAPPSPPKTKPAPTPIIVNDEDDDFFGAFSTKSKISPSKPNANSNAHVNFASSPMGMNDPTNSPRPPSEFETNDQHNESISILSKSTNGTARSARRGPSPFDDPKFAPKPAKPQGLDSARVLAHKTPAGASALPDFDLVTHSGYVLSRISFRTILIKKWKQVFWITYGVNKLLIFRSTADFEDWISNPFLNKAQREFLVKLKIDLIDDLGKQNVRGYQLTNQRMKNYNSKNLYQFKIERWMDYGPTIAGAFGSQNEREIFQLRTIFGEMLKRCPQDKGLQGLIRENQFTLTKKSYEESPHITTPQRYGHNANGHHGHNNYSSNASTGMMYDQPSTTGISTKSNGALSTPGDMGRGRRDPDGLAVAGYYPSATRGPSYRY